MAEHGGVADLKTQLDFAIDEIQNKYSDYLNNLRKAQTAKDATAYTYAQYTGANERNISSLDDLYARVSKIEAKYAKKHKEMYGKSGSGNLDRRVRAAEESIFAKKGAKLPKFQAGKDFKVSLDYKDYYEKPDDYQTVKINTIGKYDYRPSEETVDQKVLPQNFRVESPYVLTEESFNEDRSNRDKALTNSYFTKSRGKREKREQINDIKNAIIEGSQNYIIQNSYPYIADYINSNGSEGSIKLSAKNTDISKFLEGRTIDKAVLDRVKEVAKERNVDPYDLLAHMLIEGDRDLETGSRYNTHDVIRRQLGNRFGPVEKMDLDTFKTHIGLDPNKKYKQEVVQKQVDKFMNAFNDKLNNIIVPKDPVDAVAVRITTAGRDFNPAQKGWTNPETGKTVKNSYIDMIDSAIGSLKKAYPSFDDTNK